MKRDTRLVHTGRPRQQDHLVNAPVERASTVLAASTQDLYEPTPPRRHYGRGGLSPNAELREAIAALYDADHTALAPSGLASVVLALQIALPDRPAGMKALISDSVYGPVRRYCEVELPRYGVDPVFYDPRIGPDIAAMLNDGRPTAVVLMESPGSLTFEVQDVPTIAAAARAAGVSSVIDDTWSAGLLMNPLELGVDYAAQALTKYIGGHSDFLMGAVSARGSAAERLKIRERLFGTHVSPDDAFLCLRGLRTVGLRLERSGANGLELARRLDDHPAVARVLHPALPGHPDHALYEQQFSGPAGCFSFILGGMDAPAGEAIAERCGLFGLGFSWGGFESLILPCDRQVRRSVPAWSAEGCLLRVSVGLEDLEDLWADLDAALA